MKPTPTPEKLTEAQFSKYCSFIARCAACWSADILDTSDLMREADAITVARFTDDIRERLDRLDERAGRTQEPRQ